MCSNVVSRRPPLVATSSTALSAQSMLSKVESNIRVFVSNTGPVFVNVDLTLLRLICPIVFSRTTYPDSYDGANIPEHRRRGRRLTGMSKVNGNNVAR